MRTVVRRTEFSLTRSVELIIDLLVFRASEEFAGGSNMLSTNRFTVPA